MSDPTLPARPEVSDSDALGETGRLPPAAPATASPKRPRRPTWVLIATVGLPVLLLLVATLTVAGQGDRILRGFGHNPPPVDELTVERVQFHPGRVRIDVVNPQADAVTPAMVTVDSAVVNGFEVHGGNRSIGAHQRRTLEFAYDWIEDDPYLITILASSGVPTEVDVPAAVPTEAATRGGVGWGALIGLLVGFVPVALGLVWLPALRELSTVALAGFLAFTAGLLSFLAIEAVVESFDVQASLIPAIGGAGVVATGVVASMVGLGLVGRGLRTAAGAAARRRTGALPGMAGGAGQLAAASSSAALSGATLALLVAIGIGLHNLGEGLAIGSGFATGEAGLAVALVIGFMVHNLTEGIGIAAPIARAGERLGLRRGLALAAVAGFPAVLGIWAGRYVSGPLFATLCFAIAAGAALQVVVEIARSLRRDGTDFSAAPVQGGFAAGVLVMWATGILAG